jgi:ATP-dependent DNA helicase RecG
MITPRQRDPILAIEYDHFDDIKAKEIKPSKLSGSISAFANASGGETYARVREERQGAIKIRKWNGFQELRRD